MRVWPLCGDTILTGSTVKGSAQYSENMATMISITISSLVGSVAVTSMKTLVVFRVILE